jgi:hypothetical protein
MIDIALIGFFKLFVELLHYILDEYFPMSIRPEVEGHYQKQVHASLLSCAVPSFWQCPGPRALPLHINYGAAGWS